MTDFSEPPVLILRKVRSNGIFQNKAQKKLGAGDRPSGGDFVGQSLSAGGGRFGAKIRITLDESEDKSLGESSYNILNMIVSESVGGGLFGL